jgi:hypothetical protein
MAGTVVPMKSAMIASSRIALQYENVNPGRKSPEHSGINVCVAVCGRNCPGLAMVDKVFALVERLGRAIESRYGCGDGGATCAPPLGASSASSFNQTGKD